MAKRIRTNTNPRQVIRLIEQIARANGVLTDRRSARGRTTWSWREPDLMATYLATASVGNYDLRFSRGPRGLPIIGSSMPLQARHRRT